MHSAAHTFFGSNRPASGTAGTTFAKGTSKPHHRVAGR